MGMTINEVRQVAGDCTTTHRWASVWVSEANGLKLMTFRVVKVGSEWVHCIGYDGRRHAIKPSDIENAW